MNGLTQPGHAHAGAHVPPHRPTIYHHVSIDGRGTKTYPSATQYERAVQHEMARIHHSRTGQAIFREFVLRSKRHLKVVPYEQAQLNAFASPKNVVQATLKGQPVRNGANGAVLLDGKGNQWTGTGEGSEADISFTPRNWTRYCGQQKKGHKCGAHSDEVLFHEMIHATRELRGVFNPVPLGYFYDTEEEFFAILIANLYASETGRPIDLRSDHHSFNHLTTDTNALFLPKRDEQDYRYRLVGKLITQEPRLALELRAVHAPFNPIRRYFELQRTTVPSHH